MNHNGFGLWCSTWSPGIPVLHVQCKNLADAVITGLYTCKSRKFYLPCRHVISHLVATTSPHARTTQCPHTHTHRSLPHFSYTLPPPPPPPPTPSLTAFIISYRPSAFFLLDVFWNILLFWSIYNNGITQAFTSTLWNTQLYRSCIFYWNGQPKHVIALN